ncbi:MAG: DinB family protein [Chloracidobacterium sp.]|nr:DinB family protein [Chloracidobacterium sp.]
MIKDLLLAEFNVCYDENSWFVAVRNAINGLGVEQASWKPDDSVNCIWETLSHLTYYNNAYLQRFKGVDYQYDVSDNNETFSTGEYTEEHWQADVMRFDEVMNQFREAIAVADENKFSEQVSSENTRSWARLISDINTHNAYHAGQIVLLRKLQSCWDSSKGVS